MNLFDQFAQIYASGNYRSHSQAMAAILPALMKEYKITFNGSKRLLDIACGEGSFCAEMAKKGWNVTGIDQSEEMLRLANHQAKNENIAIDYKNQDMRFIDFQSEFDLATCWFGSLNYLINNSDLQSTFNNIYRSLKPNGWFLFDMVTIYGLAVGRQRNACFVQQETKDLLELHRTQYDFEKNLGCIKITWFVKVEDKWEKYEEKHTNRGFSLSEIEKCLEYAGFRVVDVLGSLSPISPLERTSARAWFLARK